MRPRSAARTSVSFSVAGALSVAVVWEPRRARLGEGGGGLEGRRLWAVESAGVDAGGGEVEAVVAGGEVAAEGTMTADASMIVVQG